jgi:hypothetical protein
VGGVHQFQIVQAAPDRTIIRVVPSLAWGPDHAERIRRVVQADLGSGMRVDVEKREWLERPGGGKLKIVVNQVEDRAREG